MIFSISYKKTSYTDLDGVKLILSDKVAIYHHYRIISFQLFMFIYVRLPTLWMYSICINKPIETWGFERFNQLPCLPNITFMKKYCLSFFFNFCFLYYFNETKINQGLIMKPHIKNTHLIFKKCSIGMWLSYDGPKMTSKYSFPLFFFKKNFFNNELSRTASR